MMTRNTAGIRGFWNARRLIFYFLSAALIWYSWAFQNYCFWMNNYIIHQWDTDWSFHVMPMALGFSREETIVKRKLEWIPPFPGYRSLGRTSRPPDFDVFLRI